ncbi:hypothetical protein ONE63_001034 [Megalurothrips usitatus]|uniref:Uncharacterized protein n=1 Tax=Megalurothrips usitatus TaxID=439358 RepID=A0AAV7XAV2_9NEOP|nr:hypothetical protein ONE63_001034 [Megalurothrips usitatus]
MECDVYGFRLIVLLVNLWFIEWSVSGGDDWTSNSESVWSSGCVAVKWGLGRMLLILVACLRGIVLEEWVLSVTLGIFCGHNLSGKCVSGYPFNTHHISFFFPNTECLQRQSV